jgi:hypothetical protein
VITASHINAGKIDVGKLIVTNSPRKPANVTMDSIRNRMDRLILLSIPDLKDLQQEIRGLFNMISDEDVPTEATVYAMTELVDMHDIVVAEIQRRKPPKVLTDYQTFSSVTEKEIATRTAAVRKYHDESSKIARSKSNQGDAHNKNSLFAQTKPIAKREMLW